MKYKILARVDTPNDPCGPPRDIFEQLGLKDLTYDAVEFFELTLKADLVEIQNAFHKLAVDKGLTEFVVEVNGEVDFIFGALARVSTIARHLDELKQQCKAGDSGYRITEVIHNEDGIEVGQGKWS
jgi:hypothetical protein